VNFLARLIRDRQTIAANLITTTSANQPSDRVGLSQILSSPDFPSNSRLADVQQSAPSDVRAALGRSYLPIVRESDWQTAFDLTSNRPPAHSHRWVTFVPAGFAEGLTVPDDDSPRESLSLFTDLGINTGVITVPLTGPAVAEIVRDGHCTLPVRGKCAPGCGSCVLHEVMGRRNGLVCICEHI
jgi:hypothetical protein